MKEFLTADLAKIIEAHPEPSPLKKSFFTGVSTDSRTTKVGDCFFAIIGENFDGHDYVADAFAKGAVCTVVGKDISSADKVILKVDDTVKALGDFAAEYRRLADYKVVAITGSAGKTTVRQITYHVLSRHFHVYQSPKNFNNNIGLPLTLLGADPEHEIVIAELGTNHPGEISYLTRIAQPGIAVVTNVYPVHLEGLGDLQTIAQEKLSIAEGLQPNGVLIINADLVKWTQDPRLKPAPNKVEGTQDSRPRLPFVNHQLITFGKSEDSDYQVQNITYHGASCRFTIDGTQIYLPLPGVGSVENAIAAWAICSRFGLTIDDFAQAVKTVKTIPMRVELLQIGTLTVVNDCYNANPTSMKNALEILTNLNSTGGRRLVFICGDMAELGQQSQLLHAELGASIAQAEVQLLLTVGKFAKITAEAAKSAADYNIQVKCLDDTLSVCNNLQKFIKDYDIILVKGSRTAKLETVIEKLKELS